MSSVCRLLYRRALVVSLNPAVAFAVVNVLRYSEVRESPETSVSSVVSLRKYSVEKLRFSVGEMVSVSPFVEREISVITQSSEPLFESWTDPTQLPFSVVVTLEADMASEKVIFGLVVTSTATDPLSGWTLSTVGDSESDPPGAHDHSQLRKKITKSRMKFIL